MDFKKVRFRLTFLYTAILAGLSVIIVTILFISMWLSIETTNSRSLRTLAQQLGNAYELSNRVNNSEALDSILQTLNEEDTTYLIYNDRLERVLESNNYPVDEESAFYLVEKFFASRHDDGEITDFDRGTDSYKVCTDAYITQDGSLIMIELIKNMSSQRALMEEPLVVSIITIIVGIILSIIIGNILARRTLRPIRDNYNSQQTFIANASHELRTPLAVILTNLEAQKADQGESVWLNNAYSEVKYARNIIEDLLFLSRADLGESEISLEPVDLSYLVLEISERLEVLAEKKGISLSYKIAETEIFVTGDKSWLTELLTILIENAIKYTESGGKILVDLTCTDLTARIDITDTGLGIAKEDQDKIFERFYMVDKVRSRSEGGAGLGLSIASLICKKLDIEISVKSTLGEGSTFSLEFNRVKPNEER